MKKWLLVVVLALLVSFVFPAPILAILDPDLPPAVNGVLIYSGLMETGDIGVLVDYYIDYAILPPAETATESYLVAFIDTNGTTQLKAVAPYSFSYGAFNNKGYRRAMAWIYFSAAEVAADSIDSADIALYSVWLMGNPTVPSGWPGNPPKTTAGVDYWQTTGDSSVILAIEVLYLASTFEAAWNVDMIGTTPLGNKLTTAGESYFDNAVPNLRTMAPNAYAASTYKPAKEDVDYTTEFGATATGAVLAGSPVTLVSGANALNATGAGNIVFELVRGTSGTVSGAKVAGSPVAVVAGTNTVSVTGVGAFSASVSLVNTATGIESSIISTGFDLTSIATTFGLSRWVFSGCLWMILAVVMCSVALRWAPDQYGGANAGKILIPLLVVWIGGGILLGLLHPIVGALLLICFVGFYVGYIIFFRQANA